jgi:hypothetical protein
MNVRNLPRVLATLAAVLAAGELVSAVIIWREAYPDSVPAFGVAFAVLFAGGAWLVRSGRVVAGAILTGTLIALEIVTFPSWTRHGAVDWIFQITFAVLSLIGLAVAVAVLVTRRSARSRASVSTDV